MRVDRAQQSETPLSMVDQTKTALVLGLDASGQAACHLLISNGNKVLAFNSASFPIATSELVSLENAGVTVITDESTIALAPIDLVVLSNSISQSEPIVQELALRGCPLISDLELATQKYFCPSIAVAGTNGKTTTAELIERMMRSANRTITTAGGSGHAMCALTEQTRQLDFIALEVNSFQLEKVEHFRPSVAVLLNLKPDHMDRYDRMANYVRTITRVFQNQQIFDWAIIQSEALAQIRSLGLAVPSKTITFSASNRHADLYLDRSLLVSRIPGWTGPLLDLDHCLLRGPHQAENLMAALAVGHVLRLPLEEMVEALKSHPGGSHRCELVAEVNGVTFINDSKGMNVDAVRKAIESISEGRGGEPNVWLIAGGRDKGLDYHDLCPLLARRVKGTFLLGESREKLRAAWSLFTPCTLTDSLLEAVRNAAEVAVAGDVILLSPACSSFDMFQNYQHRGEVFRQAVELWSEKATRASSEKTLPSPHN